MQPPEAKAKKKIRRGVNKPSKATRLKNEKRSFERSRLHWAGKTTAAQQPKIDAILAGVASHEDGYCF